MPIVLGYYPSWSTNLTAQNIRWELFTDIAHAFITVSPSGDPTTAPGIPDSNLTNIAHQHGVRVLLAVGGAGDLNFGPMARDPVKAARFIAELAAMVKANGYDGVAVDWEFPDETDQDVLIDFLTQLRAKLKADNPNALLEEAVACTDHFGHLFPAARMAPLLDYIQVMSYDVHGPWSPFAGHNSPLYHTSAEPADGQTLSFSDFLEYWTSRGFPKSKILIGLASYGHGYTAGALGQATNGKSPYADIPYNKILELIESGWTVHRDTEADVPYLTDPTDTTLISFDDEASARDKGQWAKQQGLPGIFFWEIAQDYSDDDNPLVRAARTGFGLSP
jgi:chitinase